MPLAAARQLLLGKVLYRDVWFDKPPLVPLIYLLWGARIGIVLRVAGAVYCGLVAWLAYATSTALWGDREGRWSAVLMAFFLTFDTPSSVLPLAADLLLIAPHLLAILLAVQGRFLASGMAAGLGLLFNAKAMFVLASCAVFAGWGAPLVAAGFLLPGALSAGILWRMGAWQAYVDQVWTWPAAYANNTFLERPWLTGMLRTGNWAGFHAGLVVAAGRMTSDRPRRLQLAAWALISLAGVALGWRFFPRYYFLLLPVAVVAASRGMILLGNRWWLAAILLLVPLARFGPRYVLLATHADRQWSDLALDRESRDAAEVVNARQHPGDTLFVWGFRPDLFAYTGLPAASRYIDCQAMTGVPADRHLTQSGSVLPASETAAARRELAASRPTFIVDGLSEYNHQLAMTVYPELRDWLSHYREIARVRGMAIYRRQPD